MPQLDPASFPSQLFWLAVCFGTMLLVLSVFVLPRITRTLATRQGRIDGDLEAAEKLRADAEAALAAYDAALQQARNNALALAQEMRAEIQAETDRQKAELDARLAEEAQKAEARLQAARDAALGGLDAAARDVVGDVIQAVGLATPGDADIDAALKAAQKG
ncbi:MAG: F0F1 ATP synthase subunit B' [Parvibaculales bacterium]